MVSQLQFASRLRDSEFHGEALEEALDVFFPDEEERDKVRASSNTHIVDGSTIRKKRLRLDALSINMERRELQYLVDCKAIESAHVYSDGSPVTGTEIQGMLLELWLTSGIMTTIIMPGMALHYGFCRVVDKALAFLWALWLVCGPRKETFLVVHDVIVARNLFPIFQKNNNPGVAQKYKSFFKNGHLD
jgi:hypothetical protein